MKEYIVPCDDDVSEFESMKENTELIRCKDCKNYLTDDGIGIMCQMHYYRVKPTDFCSWAERKDNETD